MDIASLLHPKKMAVIGVSRSNDLHPANVIFVKNQLRYPVQVFPVNPKGGELLGERIYRSVGEIEGPVDLALVAVRAEQVEAVLEDCIAAGVGGAVVISGGFAESGEAGLQERIVRRARQANFPFIGPNCLGIYSPGLLDTFFLPSERMVRPEAGNVALVSQSGGFLVDMLVKFAEEGVGLRLGVSIGNKALIRETDFLRHLAEDPATAVIAFYVEGFGSGEGREFVLAARDCGKPVVILKAGTTPGGSRAVASHTASLAGDYAVFSGVMAQHGVVEARDEYEFIAFCEALSCYHGAPSGGLRLGIVSGSGGHGALAVDACSRQGLEVPVFDETTRAAIRARLSPSIQGIAGLGNPIDLTGSALEEDFVAAVEAMGALDGIDALLVLLLPYLPGISADLSARLSRLARRIGKPLFAYVPHIEKFRMLMEGFELNNVPVSSSIDGAVRMARAIARCRPCRK